MSLQQPAFRRRQRLGGSAPPPADSAMVSSVREAVLADAAPVTGASVAAAVRSSGRLLGTAGTLEAVSMVRAELSGLGPLQPLLRDQGVTDILVNGSDDVWIDNGAGLEKTTLCFTDDESVRQLAARLVAAGGRRLDDSNPCVDVQFDSFRVHAVIPPVSTRGTLLSIRIRRPRTFTLEELEQSGTFDEKMQDVLLGVVSNRLNFLVSGSTGSGKTTLLSSLLGHSPPGERLVLVEDAAELRPAHGHIVGLQSRHGNVEGQGIVDLAELVRQALRMRPDRLIVGECRGAEVRELLAAMNTGHSGAGGTIHANSAAAVPARLAALGSLAGLTGEALALQATSALDVVIHMSRSPTGRRVQEIAILESGEPGVFRASPALRHSNTGTVPGPAWGSLQALLEKGPAA